MNNQGKFGKRFFLFGVVALLVSGFFVCHVSLANASVSLDDSNYLVQNEQSFQADNSYSSGTCHTWKENLESQGGQFILLNLVKQKDQNIHQRIPFFMDSAYDTEVFLMGQKDKSVILRGNLFNSQISQLLTIIKLE